MACLSRNYERRKRIVDVFTVWLEMCIVVSRFLLAAVSSYILIGQVNLLQQGRREAPMRMLE
ncbi:Uncharacterized protein TCM_001173 [Theobroma cacao]|uniref:Uncharacterized protein n=1 Tax=Theobroma cacao TaxID=3641 RepID=A0A061DIV2_THECC|nr:Uncharacterized protein TCM_001173 [Theobroma cacao]